ncbi:MAG TPA: ATP-dependent sacrificial sulfur transferase LarE [Planctomycetaceae bacterium]|nr:ATP-dependent sacrificial sulfur transferase LarE [Planctomycetaceae bacterium]
MDVADLASKEERLLELLRSYGRVAVAFSAGVDSTVVAAAAFRACGDRALAVTAVSPSLPSGELAEAQRLAALIGIRHEILRTDEFSNPDYVRNPFNRCYFCKSTLYQHVLENASRWQVDAIVNGANLDDLGDYRPGMQAATEFRVASPLVEAGFRKDDIRDLARKWDLPIWDKPASPCLSSRIAYGLEVTPERVRRVDDAEAFLRKLLSCNELRVRHEFNDLARIEVPLDVLPRLTAAATRDAVVERLRSLGFKSVTVDLQGFRSGSFNQLVGLDTRLGSSPPQ